MRTKSLYCCEGCWNTFIISSIILLQLYFCNNALKNIWNGKYNHYAIVLKMSFMLFWNPLKFLTSVVLCSCKYIFAVCRLFYTFSLFCHIGRTPSGNRRINYTLIAWMNTATSSSIFIEFMMHKKCILKLLFEIICLLWITRLTHAYETN